MSLTERFMAQNQEYGNAYDENDNYGDSGTQNVNPGTTVAQSQPQQPIQQKQTTPQQQPLNTAPNEAEMNNNINQQGQPQQGTNAFVKFCNWFPLRYFAFLAGVAFLATPILDMIFGKQNSFINVVVFVYLIFFGLVIMFVESPTWKCTRRCQLSM